MTISTATTKAKQRANSTGTTSSKAKTTSAPKRPQPQPQPQPQPYKPPNASKAPKIPEDMNPQLALITASSRTPFEKRVWTALCTIPRGHFTTYGILSAHLGTSPRAVGNALRRNPFAPGVPCHRVVATGQKLGGFKGDWPKEGEESVRLDEKRGLLRGEGVRFGNDGRVLGTPWSF